MLSINYFKFYEKNKFYIVSIILDFNVKNIYYWIKNLLIFPYQYINPAFSGE